jgi:hypothetical protein
VAKTTRKTKAGTATQQKPGSQRKVIVFMALLTVMTATSALLLALAPAPLAPGAVSSLFAVGTTDSLDPIFQTSAPMEAGRWKYVYIHHSKTDGGSAASLGESGGGLADHFVIGNGAGCGDGEIQIAQRWHRQHPAGRIVAGEELRPDCISICVIGDFDRSLPTATQMLRLRQLVTALQARCGIPAAGVHVVEGERASKGNAGRYFPVANLREALLP